MRRRASLPRPAASQATVSWTAPASNGGSAITSYTVNPSAGSFLQLWPTGSTQPVFGSSLNYNKDQIVPNQVTVKLGTAGKVRVYNAVGTVNVIADVSGYYKAGSGKAFFPIVPGRVLDSRSGPTNVGAFSTPWSPGVPGIRDVQIGGLVGVPSDADGVVLNVTVVNPTAGSFLQLWPLGSTQPVFGSSLNFAKDQIVLTVTVFLGTAGSGSSAVGTDVIADVAGLLPLMSGGCGCLVLPGGGDGSAVADLVALTAAGGRRTWSAHLRLTTVG